MDFTTFLFGCVGALSPEVIRLYKLRNRAVKFSRFYFLISGLFAVVGGFVAIAVSSTTIWGSFYSGLTLPIIISNVFGKAPETKRALVGKVTRMAVREFLGILFH